MAEKKKIEVYVAMNEDGDFETGGEASEASERLVENYGGVLVRVVKMNVAMSAPEIEQVSVDVPDEVGTVEAQPETEDA